MSSRRDFFKKGGLLGFSVLASRLWSEEKLRAMDKVVSLSQTPFKLPPLPYALDALEPFIDKQTMELHHGKHHQAYVNKLNETPSTNIDFMATDQEKCMHVDKTTSAVIRNNLGGHVNHCFFWLVMKPNKEGKENLPIGNLATAIQNEWNGFNDFKKEFSEKAQKHFGSGWCWLIKQQNKLKIVTTPNQDNPLMQLDGERGELVLGLDVWEHAYYLKYQNKRSEYISNWWNVVNWEKAEEHYNNS